MDAGLPLVDELIPCPDPWAVVRKLAHLPHLMFLDSADKHPERGRYSYIAADPVAFHSRSIGSDDPFRDLRPNTASIDRTRTQDIPPFVGGFAGIVGYGLGRHFERIPAPRRDEFQLPDIALGLYDWVISFDHDRNRAWFISTGIAPEPADAETQWLRAAGRREIVRRHLRSADQPPAQSAAANLPAQALAPLHPLAGHQSVASNFSRDQYIAAVRRAVEYVHAGDCFQVNLSQRLLTPLREHPLELYERLRRHSPAPFGAYFDAGEFQVLSASPERFLKVSDGEVETRPIKGTRPRGATPEADEALANDLRSSAKDRAENVMIVDLLRNDLGRVCEYGTVHVTKLCEVETFRQVHHLVSEVRGKLQAGMGPFDLLRATFPGGSVTGAPKVRAMEIIAQLEPSARGPYCGALGYFGLDGASDLSILIRTMTAARGWVQFPVGGGIVADSDPQREYEETLHKAAGMLRALERP